LNFHNFDVPQFEGVKMLAMIIALLVVLINYPLSSSDWDFYKQFEIKRISANFNGSDYNGNALLVYGDGGVILRSTNIGQNWEQINLNDSLNILEMVHIGTSFYGISDAKYLIYSFNNGVSWNLVYFGNEFRFHRIFNLDSNILIVSNKGLWKINQNLQKQILYNWDWDTLKFSTELVGKTLFYSSYKGVINFLSLTDSTIGTLNLDSLGICTNCPIPNGFFSDKVNSLYFFVEEKLYEYDLKYRTIKFLYSPESVKNSAFFARNDNIYQIYSKKFESLHLDSLYFGKYDKQNQNFILLKTPFNDRYIWNIKLKNLNFITNDTLIAVGDGKLIYISYDGGINWTLKSLLNEFSTFFLLDTLHFRSIAYYARFFATNNGGVIWLPQKNYDTSYLFQPFQNPFYPGNFIFFLDANKGFFIAQSDNLDKIAKTKDGGETIEIQPLKGFQHLSNNLPLLTKFDSSVILVTMRNILGGYLIFDKITPDLEFQRITYFKKLLFYYLFNIDNSLYAIGNDTTQNNPNLYCLYISRDTARNWEKDTCFLFKVPGFFSTDLSDVNRIDTILLLTFSSFQKYPSSSGIITLLAFNIKTRQLFEVLQSDNFSPSFAIKIKRQIALFDLNGSVKFIPIDSLKPSAKLYNYTFRRFSPPKVFPYTRLFNSDLTGVIGDSIFAFVAYDSLFKSDALFIAKCKTCDSINIPSEPPYIPDISITEPYPNPTSQVIRFKIFWNQKYDISQVRFNIYDLTGRALAEIRSFSIVKLNNYSAEVWTDVSAFSKGIYIIVATLGNTIKFKPFIID
jgi:photosystem II stability/assembly factor-like uncharacterized protein